MKTSIYACGFSVDNGKPTQRGACAAILEHSDDHDRKACRIISEPVGSSTGPQCDLKAAILGLMTVSANPRFRKSSVDLFVSKYAAQFLERDGEKYKLDPKKNAELVRRLREKADLFGNLTVQIGTKEQLQLSAEHAKGTAETGFGGDSGTTL